MTKDTLDQLPPLRDVIARHALMARKSLGQHFLCDLNLTRKIVSCAGNLDHHTVFEIGPGPGGLTRALLANTDTPIIAIEKDPRCVAALQDVVIASEGRLKVICGDALTIDLTTLAPKPRAVVANLPYNIGTELLLGWLHHMEEFTSLTLMFQSEVVDRMVAVPGNKSYGRLSVITQFCCQTERVLNVPAEAFTPPPKVDSAIVHLTPRRDRPQDIAIKILSRVTAAAFGQRRKMLRASLKTLGGLSLLEKSGINPELRAENLTLADFENLARHLG